MIRVRQDTDPAASSGANLRAKLDTLPTRPGVYLLKDARGKVIYVGKARSLRTRVRTYFGRGDERYQVRFLMRRIADIETLVTRNDKEALLLEYNLIKQYKPRYNIRLKDDKSYASVKVTVGEKWPRIFITRKIVQDGSRYFGPFTSAHGVRQALDTIRRVVPLRTCSDGVFRNRSRPCLEFQIKRCLGPCCVPVDLQEYRGHLREAVMLLEGKRGQLTRSLREQMRAAAEGLHFEEAARLRDRLRAIEATQEPQHAITHGCVDRDVFALHREGGAVEVQVLHVRRGKLTGNRAYRLEDYGLPDREILSALLGQYYQGVRVVPEEVIVPVLPDDMEERAELLSERKGHRVRIVQPQRGARARLLEMAIENAAQSFRERQDEENRYEEVSEELGRRLHLHNGPKRIECFDISNFHGGEAVGSMIVFDEGRPDKSGYRRFRIRTVRGANDFGMMYEVLKRRYRKAKQRREYPDLLVVDGGKGHLNVALAVLRDLEIDEIDPIGLAKMRVARDAQSPEVQRSEDRVFIPGRKNPILFRRNSRALFLLQRARDEAHRFAVSYHRKLRRRERLRFGLVEIAGVGPEKSRRLLRCFGSLKRLGEASVDELCEVSGISRGLAERIREALRVQARSASKTRLARRLVLRNL